MALRTALKYLALAIGALVVLSVAFSVLTAIVGLVWTIVTSVVTLLVLAGMVYGGYKAFSWLRSGSASTGGSLSGAAPDVTSGTERRDPVDRLKQRYADGDISEAEFERRLEHSLDDGTTDEIDRELERDRR